MAQIDWSKPYNSEWYKKLMDDICRDNWSKSLLGMDFSKLEERVAAAYYPSAGEHTWGERKSASGIFKYYGTSSGRWSSPYTGTMKENLIQGLKADWIIFDEYSNLGAKMPKLKPPKKDYNTVGVRFLAGHNLAKIYTYRIRKGAKVHLGQELVAPTPTGDAVVCVVQIHKAPQDTGPYEYKTIESKVAPL